ncbi:hypothetical protein [Limnothrix sp. PR1529]|uniref:hypothetical protein n=1 Tax=Limnothrix sp. PR1529 TaxID=1704291 RepID=UPI001F23BC10|nr:hypothetical protein [Limnothrix sp. PR1529]
MDGRRFSIQCGLESGDRGNSLSVGDRRFPVQCGLQPRHIFNATHGSAPNPIGNLKDRNLARRVQCGETVWLPSLQDVDGAVLVDRIGLARHLRLQCSQVNPNT